MKHLAQRLWEARRDGTVIEPTESEGPKSDSEAYRLQREIAELSGQEGRGFKVGATSALIQQLLGTGEPVSGVLPASWVFDSPATVAVSPLHSPAIEGEFAFRLGRDLPSRTAPYRRAEVADAVEAVAGAVEVVGSRVAGLGSLTSPVRIIGDGAGNIALVTGVQMDGGCPYYTR